ncbi:hypothetical protein YK48G_08070 [Lentilactobacillus fungorum]|uniref:HTH cro/C1-type domain-containing protein n=1 Tax=Lentilactobacillus fungorum TaxID=2201250 RepID=A0ABQ3VYU0_9LACO|nr:helix-turn-helix transcriptional regulator [Lentilactobacillus fungorum]GHP13382.1 hypothetical protein YK48G_08070 [Lentilactobacillus fungorum]
MPKTEKLDSLIQEYTDTPQTKVEYEQGKTRLIAAHRFMKAREAAGLSQRDLANAAGVPQRTVARVELADNTSLATLEKLATALGKKLEISLN